MLQEPLDANCDQPNSEVFIVDDDAILRRSLQAVLGLAGFKVSQFASARQFLAHSIPSQSGCALVDMRMPEMNGLELQEELAGRCPFMSVIIITGHADVRLAVRAMKSGAFDVLEKPFGNEKLVAQVKAALAISAAKVCAGQRRNGLQQKLRSLSNRERNVMNLIVEGHSNKEIATALNLSPRTVDIHRARVMKKLGAGSAVELVRMVLADS
jgi:two-component system, LuxR family, response regulator FixJ